MTTFKKASSVGEPNLFSAELLAELGTSFEYCTVLRKKKAAEFIGSHIMEVLGDLLTKRLMVFKHGQYGVVFLQDCEEGAPVAKRAKVEEGT